MCCHVRPVYGICIRIPFSKHYRYEAFHLYLYVTNYYIFVCTVTLLQLNMCPTLIKGNTPEIQQWHLCNIWPSQHRIHGLIFGRETPLALVVSHNPDSINGTIAFLNARGSKWHATLLFGHVLPLASVSHDANGIFNGIIAFLRSRWLKWGATWHFGHVKPLAPASDNVDSIFMASLHSLYPDNWNEVQHDFWLCDANGIINGTIAFVGSRWLKWSATWPFWSCDAFSTGICIKWCWWCPHCIP